MMLNILLYFHRDIDLLKWHFHSGKVEEEDVIKNFNFRKVATVALAASCRSTQINFNYEQVERSRQLQDHLQRSLNGQAGLTKPFKLSFYMLDIVSILNLQ